MKMFLFYISVSTLFLCVFTCVLNVVIQIVTKVTMGKTVPFPVAIAVTNNSVTSLTVPALTDVKMATGDSSVTMVIDFDLYNMSYWQYLGNLIHFQGLSHKNLT